MTVTKPAAGWVEISIQGPSFVLEAVADFLTSLGSGGAIFSEAKPSKPGVERLTGFLAQDRKLPGRMGQVQKYLADLPKLFPDQGISSPKIQTIIDQDWINKWRDTVVPTRISRKFWVVPEWQKPPKEALAPGFLIITMEPGLAFGTGYHATTQLCLGMIEELTPEPAAKVLDAGTGTGILAMAAAMLGAKKVIGIDLDPLSLKVAEDNIRRNGLQNKIELVRAGSETGRRLVRFNFDLIVANLFDAELKRLGPYLIRHLGPGGYLAVSGILPDQTADLIRFYQKLGMKVLKRKEQDQWIAILMKKN